MPGSCDVESITVQVMREREGEYSCELLSVLPCAGCKEERGLSDFGSVLPCAGTGRFGEPRCATLPSSDVGCGSGVFAVTMLQGSWIVTICATFGI